MAKSNPIGIRLDDAEKAALERAAAADDRPVSAMARKLIVEGLAARGLLKPAKGRSK